MRILSASSAEAGISLVLMAVALFLTLAAGLFAVALIPLTLLALFLGLSDRPFTVADLAWLWFPVALILSFQGIVSGLEAINDPDWRRLLKLALLTAAIPLTAPIVWWILGAS